MGTTLTAITNDAGVALETVVAIEGYGYLLTTGDPAAVLDAWTGTDWSSALAGLEMRWAGRQDLDPWSPFQAGNPLTFAVMDSDGSDRFGIDTHRKEGGARSRLTADASATDTTIAVLDGSVFNDGDTIWIGPEAITIGTVVGNNLTGCTRGVWSPFTTGAAPFARSHRAVPTVAGSNELLAVARSIPTDWVGRWVAVYQHRRLGDVLDVLSEAHLCWAGRVASVRDANDGRTVVQCDDLRSVIASSVVFREQFTARVGEGIYLPAGFTVGLRDDGDSVSGKIATDFTCVASGASGATQIDAGFYTLGEIETALNAWLAGEKGASRLNYAWSYTAEAYTSDGPRGRIQFTDSLGSYDNQTGHWSFNSWQVARDLGWDTLNHTVHVGYTTWSGREISPNPPLRVVAPLLIPGVSQDISIEAQVGSYVDQSDFLASALTGGGFGTGILRIGGVYFAATAPSGDVVTVRWLDQPALLGLDANGDPNQSPGMGGGIAAGQDGTIAIEQVLILQQSFAVLVASLLSSVTGAAFNGNFDLLPEQCGVPVPYSLTGDDFFAELAATDGGLDPCAVVIEKATRFADLWNVSFILRGIALIWRMGRLTLAGWATPTSAATLTVTEAKKARPIDVGDDLLSVTEQSDEWMRNVIKINHNRAPFSETYRETTNLLDTSSANANGSKTITLDARNAVRSSAVAGEDVDHLLQTFVSLLPFLTRPVMKVRVPVDRTCIETHTPGQVVLFTDDFARDPSSGVRRITGKPALIVASDPHWEAGTVELDLMLFPQASLAPYCPTAQIDDGATNAGYDNATKTLTCYAHEHSETSAAADASLFPANAKVQILQIDPDDETAPLRWDRTVASQSGNTIVLTATLSSPAWDNKKKYRVIPQDYANATGFTDKCFQADSADDLVEDQREAYGYTYWGVGQTASYTASAATEIPERHSDVMFGDGKPVDTGTARAMARAANNLVYYKTAPQDPSIYSEASAFGIGPGGATWSLVRWEPIYLGPGNLDVNRTIKLYVAPLFHSTDGSSASVRVTLSVGLPSGSSLYDVTIPAPSTSATFTDTSTTDVAPTAQALDAAHIYAAGGFGYLLIEITTKAASYGLIECRRGPLVAP